MVTPSRPAPPALTVPEMTKAMRVKAAVTVLFPFIVTGPGFAVPVRSPDQLSKLEPASGVAVKVTTVPSLKEAVQTGPQLIPNGEDTTVPAPVPALMTVSVKDFGAGGGSLVWHAAAPKAIKAARTKAPALGDGGFLGILGSSETGFRTPILRSGWWVLSLIIYKCQRD